MNADFVAGSGTVRALDRATGQVQWRDSFQLVPGGDAFANAVAVAGDTIYTGGAAQDSTGGYRWSLRVYDAKGTLRGRDEGDPGSINALAAGEGRVYAAGFIGLFDTPTFAVRAYRRAERGED